MIPRSHVTHRPGCVSISLLVGLRVLPARRLPTGSAGRCHASTDSPRWTTAQRRCAPADRTSSHDGVASAKEGETALGARRFAADTLADDAFCARCRQVARRLRQAARLDPWGL